MNEIHSVNSTSWPLVEKNWTPVWTAAGQFCALVRVRGFVTGLRQPRPQANTTQTIVTVFSPLTPKSPLKDSSTHYGSLSSHSILWEKESKVLLFLCKLWWDRPMAKEISHFNPNMGCFVSTIFFCQSMYVQQICSLGRHGISLAFQILPEVPILRSNSFGRSTQMQLEWFDMEKVAAWNNHLIAAVKLPFWGD